MFDIFSQLVIFELIWQYSFEIHSLACSNLGFGGCLDRWGYLITGLTDIVSFLAHFEFYE